MRNYLNKQGFLEVETPMMHQIAGVQQHDHLLRTIMH